MSEIVRPCVSVIIPTFRRPGLLREAVQSVLAQTFTDLELIVVDDDPGASARGTVEACADRRIVYLAHGENRGAAAARNTGLAAARGEFIAFLDDDDLWHPQFLSKMTAAMKSCAGNVGVLHCAVEDVGRQGGRQVRYPRHRGDVHAAMLRGEKSGGILGLVRREVFSACGVFDENLPSAQDWDLWLRVSARFHFDYIPDVLATVRDCGERISSDPARAIAARELILSKYAGEFERNPQARVVHLKRLAKLNSFVGRWGQVWRYFREASRGRPIEAVKAAAWLVCERPFLSSPDGSGSGRRWLLATVLFALAAALYSQAGAFRSPYLVNDDVCQHLWWMRSFQIPGLFAGDLLARYAESLQPFGVLVLYHLVAIFTDPLVFARVLPLVLLPVTCFFIFRLARRLSTDDLTACLVAMSFAVTKIFLQHMTGGHAHSFGYPLLAAFLYYFLERRAVGMTVTLGLAALFFPVIFALGALTWLWTLLPLPGRTEGATSTGREPRLLLYSLIFGLGILAVKAFVSADPSIGVLLDRRAVAAMPELTSAGRWAVWPPENIFSALARFAEEGIFVFRVLWKSSLPSFVQQILSCAHLVLLASAVAAWFWWRRRARLALTGFFLPVLAASVFLYLLSSLVELRLYAPDRYLSYTLPVLALLFILVPLGASVSALSGSLRRALAWTACLAVIVPGVLLIKNAGLQDYSRYRALYSYLATLPDSSLIAAHPVLADGIPLFARRRVWVNFEMSVPLYDRYWQTVSERTRDLFQAYYSGQAKTVVEFMRTNGLTHLVLDRDDFLPPRMSRGIYFEPFETQIRQQTRCHGNFVLLRVPETFCVFKDGALCVLDRQALDRLAADGNDKGAADETNCVR
ncbi:MAG: glycosyltransferase [Candidatus Omnitrophica bacterium]|nr:glycosyltransferase [Candidatus Omnitrophota bacterium]